MRWKCRYVDQCRGWIATAGNSYGSLHVVRNPVSICNQVNLTIAIDGFSDDSIQWLIGEGGSGDNRIGTHFPYYAMNGDFEFYRGIRRRRENRPRASHLCDSEFKTEEGRRERARNLFQLHRLLIRENAFW